jgi:hypothetical protein
MGVWVLVFALCVLGVLTLFLGHGPPDNDF